MKRIDKIKLGFTRHWKIPGKERLAAWLKPKGDLSDDLRNGITWLTGEDIAIYTSAKSYIEWVILSSGTYEDEINKLIRVSLVAGGSALDIGANIGLQSLRMSQRVGPAGQVFAFEPLRHLQEKFRENVSLNRAYNITLHPYALADKEAEMEFNIDTLAWNQGSFSLGGGIGGIEVQKVDVKVGDEIPEIQALERLDLIKIDVEGFEFQVLRGLARTIEKHRPRIIFEYDANYWTRTRQDIKGCYQMLTDLGYLFYQITEVGCWRIGDSGNIRSGNLFCLYAGEYQR